MKLKTKNWKFILFGVAVLSLGLAGCMHKTVRIMTVDATTGEPLIGVETGWREHRHQITGPVLHTGRVELSKSDQNGNIEVHKLHKYWRSSFDFSLPGYSTVYGWYSGDTLKLGTNVVYLPPGLFESEFRFETEPQTAETRDGIFIVPIPKLEIR